VATRRASATRPGHPLFMSLRPRISVIPPNANPQSTTINLFVDGSCRSAKPRPRTGPMKIPTHEPVVSCASRSTFAARSEDPCRIRKVARILSPGALPPTSSKPTAVKSKSPSGRAVKRRDATPSERSWSGTWRMSPATEARRSVSVRPEGERSELMVARLARMFPPRAVAGRLTDRA